MDVLASYDTSSDDEREAKSQERKPTISVAEEASSEHRMAEDNVEPTKIKADSTEASPISPSSSRREESHRKRRYRQRSGSPRESPSKHSPSPRRSHPEERRESARSRSRSRSRSHSPTKTKGSRSKSPNKFLRLDTVEVEPGVQVQLKTLLQKVDKLLENQRTVLENQARLLSMLGNHQPPIYPHPLGRKSVNHDVGSGSCDPTCNAQLRVVGVCSESLGRVNAAEGIFNWVPSGTLNGISINSGTPPSSPCEETNVLSISDMPVTSQSSRDCTAKAEIFDNERIEVVHLEPVVARTVSIGDVPAISQNSRDRSAKAEIFGDDEKIEVVHLEPDVGTVSFDDRLVSSSVSGGRKPNAKDNGLKDRHVSVGTCPVTPTPEVLTRAVTVQDVNSASLLAWTEDLCKISISVGNFACNLVRMLFSEEERKNRNCSGTRGKKALNSEKLAFVKFCALKLYANAENSEKEKVWKRQCVTAIDELLRRGNRTRAIAARVR